MKSSFLNFTTLCLLILFTGYSGNNVLSQSTTKSATEQILKEAEVALQTNPVKAKNLGLKAVEAAQRENNAQLLAEAYKETGTYYFYLSQYDSTKYFWLQSKKLLENEGGKPLADIYNNLGIIYMRTGVMDSSYRYNTEALRLRNILKDTLGVGNSHLNLGSIYRSVGNFDLALEHYFKGVKVYESINRNDKLSEAYNSIGLVYLAVEDYENALSFLKQSLDIKVEKGSPRKIGNTLSNIAATYAKQKDTVQAEEYYLKAEEIFESLGDKRMLAGISTNLGVIYKNKGAFDLAITYYQKAVEGFSQTKDLEGLATAYNNLGAIYYLKNEYIQSKSAYLNALEFAKQIESMPLQLTANKGLFKSYKMLGNFDLALQHNENYVALNDSIFKKTTAETIAELREEFEAEKKARKIKELEVNALEQEKIVQNRNYQIWVVSSSSLIFIGLLLLIIMRIRFKRKILQKEQEKLHLNAQLKQKEIDLKNRELTSYASTSAQKSQFLKELIIELENVPFESNETKLQSTSIIRKIKSEVNNEDEWQKFKVHFENVHPTFFEKLKKEFPKLTANDLKQCAFVKMNLSNKEVALLLNITPKSVKMNRYRLKKKLSLEKDEALDSFLHNF